MKRLPKTIRNWAMFLSFSLLLCPSLLGQYTNYHSNAAAYTNMMQQQAAQQQAQQQAMQQQHQQQTQRLYQEQQAAALQQQQRWAQQRALEQQMDMYQAQQSRYRDQLNSSPSNSAFHWDESASEEYGDVPSVEPMATGSGPILKLFFVLCAAFFGAASMLVIIFALANRLATWSGRGGVAVAEAVCAETAES